MLKKKINVKYKTFHKLLLDVQKLKQKLKEDLEILNFKDTNWTLFALALQK